MQALPDLLMGQVVTGLDCVLAALHSVNEACLLLEMPSNDFPSRFVFNVRGKRYGRQLPLGLPVPERPRYA